MSSAWDFNASRASQIFFSSDGSSDKEGASFAVLFFLAGVVCCVAACLVATVANAPAECSRPRLPRLVDARGAIDLDYDPDGVVNGALKPQRPKK